MTQNDIIRMAREAGWSYMEAGMQSKMLERFAALVAAAEREACAKLVESEWSNVAERMYGHECAAAIRARGETK